MPEAGDVVVATNNEIIPFTIKWAKREYVLKPSIPLFIPFEAACLWFGDPRSQKDIKAYTGTDGLTAFVADRASEVRRLRCKYGAIYGDDSSFADSYKDDGKFNPGDPIFIPDVLIATPDGEKLWMVVEDPHGDHVSSAELTVAGNEDMLSQLRRQQAQIDLLMAQLTSDNPNAPIGQVNNDGDVEPPSDDDDTVGAGNKAVK